MKVWFCHLDTRDTKESSSIEGTDEPKYRRYDAKIINEGNKKKSLSVKNTCEH